MKTNSIEHDFIVQQFLRRIEKLARRLLSIQFKSASDLWQFEVELITLQRDIQVAVNEYKEMSKRDKKMLDILQELRVARQYARRLGDSLAWVVMGLNRKVIYPLSENTRTVISPEDHGSRGVLAIATHLASSGWGFPILHDVTDCLRIGDITFVSSTTDAQRIYRTVEVKTSLKSEKRDEVDNQITYEYTIQVLSAVPFDPVTGAQIDLNDLDNVERNLPRAEVTRRSDRRINRQTQRMSKAFKHQTAPDNELTEIDGEVPLLSVMTENSATSYWKSLRRVIRLARRDGYASECIEGSFLYCAFYQVDGITEDSIKDLRLIKDIQESGIIIKDAPYLNALLVNAVPPREQAVAHSFLPYYLYSIPQRAIYDLINGRLVIIVLLNQGRIVQALEEAGFSVELKAGRANPSLIVSRTVISSSGTQYKIQLPNLSRYINETIYEFHSRNYLVEIAMSMSKAAATGYELISRK